MAKTRAVYLQPSPFCNIDCTYCYLPARSNRSRMSMAVLSAVFESLFANGDCVDEIDVVWHGGEPTALPVAFYRAAFATLDRLTPRNKRLRHYFQSNGTLIDPAWCDLLKDRSIDIGISIDGPQHIHDANRKTRRGRGTFAQVMRGIECLKSRAVGFSTLSVVSDTSLDDPHGLFWFFEQLGNEHVCFLVEEIQGANKTTSLDRPDAKQRYAEFLIRYGDLVMQHGSRQCVREITSAASIVVQSAETPVANQLTDPFSIVTVDYQGNFSTFCPELLMCPHPLRGDFLFGNFLAGGISQARQSDKFRRVLAEIHDGVAKCRQTCSYFSVCAGGAPSAKLWEHGTFDAAETQLCRLRFQATTDAVLQRLVRDASAIGTPT
jgi:uncharacterized protein